MSQIDSRLTIVLVGHCGADSFLLRSAVARALPDAAVVSADDAASLAAHLRPCALLLVNRELYSEYGVESGVELIRSVAAGPAPTAAMLISNYPEAQEAAVKAGALRGFGKRDVNEPSAADLLRAAAVQVMSRGLAAGHASARR